MPVAVTRPGERNWPRCALWLLPGLGPEAGSAMG
jgi:hypothetical protein